MVVSNAFFAPPPQLRIKNLESSSHLIRASVLPCVIIVPLTAQHSPQPIAPLTNELNWPICSNFSRESDDAQSALISALLVPIGRDSMEQKLSNDVTRRRRRSLLNGRLRVG